MFYVPDIGKLAALAKVLEDSAVWEVLLYTTSVSWSDATVIGDITEATFSGYARLNPTYGAPAIVSAKAVAIAPGLIWTIASGSQTIEGYAILDENGVLRGGENFTTGPVALNVATGLVTLDLAQAQTANHT